MYAANVIEVKATNAALTIPLGYVPAYAIIMNVTSGKRVEYVNTRLNKTQMAITAGAVVNDVDSFTDYIDTTGVIATDGKVTRTPADSLGVVQSTAAGLVIAGGLTDINDTATEQLIVIAFRSEA
jgi:hypothetical protein